MALPPSSRQLPEAGASATRSSQFLCFGQLLHHSRYDPVISAYSASHTTAIHAK